MPISRRHLLLLGALAPLTGCAVTPQWRPVDLDAEPQALAVGPAGPLIGLAGPRLRGPNGAIPVRPTTGYGREARWAALATDGVRIVGVGHATGGAHGNARWSVFSGTTSVTEREQPFEIFHGEGSGQLVAATFVGSDPVLIGSWASAAAGLDVALWLPDGDRWNRRAPSAEALAATSRSLPQAHAAVGGTRLMVVGQLIELAPLRTRAVAWTSADPRGDWVRLDLPASGTTTIAEAVAVHDGGWLAAGRSDDRLVAWRIDPDLTTSTLDVPALPAPDGVRVAAAGNGELLIVAGDGGTVRALRGGPDAWQSSSPPGRAPLAAGWAASGPLVITAADQHPARLFALS